MDCQDDQVMMGLAEILVKMVQPDQRVCLDLLGQRETEDLLALLAQEAFKACLVLPGNLVSLVKMVNQVFLDNLE